MEKYLTKKIMMMLSVGFILGACSSAEDTFDTVTTAQEDYLNFIRNHYVYDNTIAGTGIGLAYGDMSEFDSTTSPLATFDDSGNVIIHKDGDNISATFIEYTVVDGAKYKMNSGESYFYISIDNFTKQLKIKDADDMVFSISEGGDTSSDASTISDGIVILVSKADYVIACAYIKESFNDRITTKSVLEQQAISGDINTENLGANPLGDATFEVGNIEVTTIYGVRKECLDKRTITITYDESKNYVEKYAQAFPEGTYVYNRVIVEENTLIFKDEASSVELSVEIVDISGNSNNKKYLRLTASNGLAIGVISSIVD